MQWKVRMTEVREKVEFIEADTREEAEDIAEELLFDTYGATIQDADDVDVDFAVERV